jgi:hypothetical protein
MLDSVDIFAKFVCTTCRKMSFKMSTTDQIFLTNQNLIHYSVLKKIITEPMNHRSNPLCHALKTRTTDQFFLEMFNDGVFYRDVSFQVWPEITQFV